MVSVDIKEALDFSRQSHRCGRGRRAVRPQSSSSLRSFPCLQTASPCIPTSRTLVAVSAVRLLPRPRSPSSTESHMLRHLRCPTFVFLFFSLPQASLHHIKLACGCPESPIILKCVLPIYARAQSLSLSLLVLCKCRYFSWLKYGCGST